jgi:hypothetical protein
MNDKDFLNFKFLNINYVKQKENELKRLEAKKIKLSQEIENEESRGKSVRGQYERLKFENMQLKTQHEELKKMIVSRGIIMDIENKGYNIGEWDNLYLEKKASQYFIVSKKGEELYSLEKNESIIIKELLSEDYICSLVAVRLAKKYIKIQLRFLRKEE